MGYRQLFKNTYHLIKITPRLFDFKKFQRIDRRYFVFVLIASIFWFISKLSKEYEHPATFNLSIVEIPDGVLAKQKTYPILLNVKATGFKLLKNNLFPNNILIDFGKMITQKQDRFVIKLNNHIRYLKESLTTSGLILLDNPVEVIKLKMVLAETKRVPILPNIHIDFKEGFNFSSPIKVMPDSLTITAHKAVLATIKAVYTKPLKFKDLQTSFETYLELQPPLKKRLKMSLSKVMVKGVVEKFTEKNPKNSN